MNFCLANKVEAWKMKIAERRGELNQSRCHWLRKMREVEY